MIFAIISRSFLTLGFATAFNWEPVYKLHPYSVISLLDVGPNMPLCMVSNAVLDIRVGCIVTSFNYHNLYLNLYLYL